MCFESLRFPNLIDNGILSLWDSTWVDLSGITPDYSAPPELPLVTFVSSTMRSTGLSTQKALMFLLNQNNFRTLANQNV